MNKYANLYSKKTEWKNHLIRLKSDLRKFTKASTATEAVRRDSAQGQHSIITWLYLMTIHFDSNIKKTHTHYTSTQKRHAHIHTHTSILCLSDCNKFCIYPGYLIFEFILLAQRLRNVTQVFILKTFPRHKWVKAKALTVSADGGTSKNRKHSGMYSCRRRQQMTMQVVRP